MSETERMRQALELLRETGARRAAMSADEEYRAGWVSAAWLQSIACHGLGLAPPLRPLPESVKEAIRRRA